MQKEERHWQEFWTWNGDLGAGKNISFSNIGTNYGDKKDCCKVITKLLKGGGFILMKYLSSYFN